MFITNEIATALAQIGAANKTALISSGASTFELARADYYSQKLEGYATVVGTDVKLNHRTALGLAAYQAVKSAKNIGVTDATQLKEAALNAVKTESANILANLDGYAKSPNPPAGLTDVPNTASYDVAEAKIKELINAVVIAA